MSTKYQLWFHCDDFFANYVTVFSDNCFSILKFRVLGMLKPGDFVIENAARIPGLQSLDPM